MLHHFALREPKQIVEGGVNAVVAAFADAQDKIALGQDAMDSVVIDFAALFILDFERCMKNGNAISEPRVMLGEGVFTDILRESVELAVDECDFDERSD